MQGLLIYKNHVSDTHRQPVKNLNIRSIHTLVEKDDEMENTADNTIAGNITALRPYLSPR